jgi:hypothetical protein
MKLATFVLTLAFTFMAGCVFNSYEYNLAHAYVTPWTKLPKAQIQEIVRVVSRSSTQSIIGVSQDSRSRKPVRVEVYTGNPDGSGPYYWNYTLEQSGSTWRIVEGGQISITVIGLALSMPPKAE